MKGNKFLAAVLAASMAFSTVPATAMNVFATAEASATQDLSNLPSTDDVETAVSSLTTAETTSADIAKLTADNVKKAITDSVSGWSTDDNVVSLDGEVTEDTDAKKTSSTTGDFAYRTFSFTLKSTKNAAGATYTVKLTAEKLTTAEDFSEYVEQEIRTANTAPNSISKGSALRNKVAEIVSKYNKEHAGANVSATVTFNSQDSSYNVMCASGDDTSETGDILITLKYTTDQVTVADKLNSTSSERKALQSAVVSNITTSNVKLTKKADGSYDTSTIASAIKTALPSYSGVQNVSVIDDDHWSFEVYDGKATYSVTINTGADLETDNAALKTALDNYFASNEVKTTKDKTLRNTDIAALVNADDNVAGVKNGFTIEGDGNALGSDGSGKLVIKNGTTTYTYNFTADVKISDKSEAEANKEALATVNAQTYPDYHVDDTVKYTTSETKVNHDEGLLKNKLTADLKDAGYNTTGLTYGTASVTEADKSTNGEYKNSITNNNDVVDVALTYSSDQKLLDTEKALEKFLAKGSSKTTKTDVAADTYTEHKKATKVALDDTVKPTEIYSFEDTSALSQKIQAKTAVKATSASDAADIVKASIDDQLTASGIADNGVNVTVKAVNKATANADDDKKYDVEAASKPEDNANNDATVGGDGKITLLVTASIKNDFYGWGPKDGKDKVKTLTYSYLMEIATNELKENKVKTISLADKTVLLTGGYYKAAKGSQTVDNEVTYVEITPVIDPADTNSKVQYTVYDSDNSVVDDVKVGEDDVYKKDSDTAVKVGTNALGLKITKAGTYTIKAKADDAEATMTLTVKKNFDDVPATAYYKDATAWAYGEGVTNGVTEDLFGVNNDVTRAQYVTWLYRYAVSQDSKVEIADDDVKSVFSDVASTAYYAKAVQWAKDAGVVDGKTDTTFAPDAKITRAEAITMLWRAYGKPSAGQGSETENTVKFTDVPANAYYATAVTWAVNNSYNYHGVVAQGTSTTTFSPNKTCSRAEGITFIYRVYG